MPYITVDLGNGCEWGLTNCEIVIPRSAINTMDAATIGTTAKALAPYLPIIQEAQYLPGFEQCHTLHDLQTFLAGIRAAVAVKTPPIQETKPGYVYVIQGQDYYKIGYTNQLATRVRTMAVKAPFPLHVRLLIPTADMVQLEGILHTRFATQRTQGEWFLLTEKDLDILAEQYITVDPAQLTTS